VYVSVQGEDHFLGDLKTESVEQIWSKSKLDKQKYWARSKWVIEND
jgi:hypothetical protein